MRRKVKGTGCSMELFLADGETIASVKMTGEKVKGQMGRTAKFNAEACKKLSETFSEMAELLLIAEVQNR